MSETLELEAGRELDALIAERVMGIPPQQWLSRCAAEGHQFDAYERDEDGEWGWCYTCGDSVHDVKAREGGIPPRYSTDMAAAWEVVEAMLARKMYPDLISSSVPVGMVWTCLVDWFVEDGDDRPPVSADAPTAPLAICRAALKAIPSPTPEGTP